MAVARGACGLMMYDGAPPREERTLERVTEAKNTDGMHSGASHGESQRPGGRSTYISLASRQAPHDGPPSAVGGAERQAHGTGGCGDPEIRRDGVKTRGGDTSGYTTPARRACDSSSAGRARQEEGSRMWRTLREGEASHRQAGQARASGSAVDPVVSTWDAARGGTDTGRA